MLDCAEWPLWHTAPALTGVQGIWRPYQFEMDKTLIIGYGNPHREDDGVAWHILNRLAERLEVAQPSQDVEELNQRTGSPHLLCTLQLDPDLAEAVAGYDRVCFVDAHTGAYPEDIRFEQLQPKFQASPFTHHMSPETCLMLAQTLHNRAPQGVVISVKGHHFGFSSSLSPQTTLLAHAAIERLICWVNPHKTSDKNHLDRQSEL